MFIPHSLHILSLPFIMSECNWAEEQKERIEKLMSRDSVIPNLTGDGRPWNANAARFFSRNHVQNYLAFCSTRRVYLIKNSISLEFIFGAMLAHLPYSHHHSRSLSRLNTSAWALLLSHLSSLVLEKVSTKMAIYRRPPGATLSTTQSYYGTKRNCEKTSRVLEGTMCTLRVESD